MGIRLKQRLMGGLLFLGLLCGQARRAEAAQLRVRTFAITTSYGLMAGTLVGLGSLAFYSRPGDHFRNIAIGASVGLYVGILMGFYVTYFVNNDDGKVDQRMTPQLKQLEPEAEPVDPNNPIDLGLAPTLIPVGSNDLAPGLGLNLRF